MFTVLYLLKVLVNLIQIWLIFFLYTTFSVYWKPKSMKFYCQNVMPFFWHANIINILDKHSSLMLIYLLCSVFSLPLSFVMWSWMNAFVYVCCGFSSSTLLNLFFIWFDLIWFHLIWFIRNGQYVRAPNTPNVHKDNFNFPIKCDSFFCSLSDFYSVLLYISLPAPPLTLSLSLCFLPISGWQC